MNSLQSWRRMGLERKSNFEVIFAVQIELTFNPSYVRSFYLFLALMSVTAIVSGQRPGASGPSTSSSNAIFYIDPLLNESTMAGDPIDASEFLADYRFRPGDVVSLTVRGGITLIVRAAVVNSSGEILIPEVGAIAIGGLSYAEALTTIQQSVGKTIKNATTTFSLEKPAPIKIQIKESSSSEKTIALNGPKRLLDIVTSNDYSFNLNSTDALTDGVNLREVVVTDAEGKSITYDLLPALRGLKYRAQNPFIFDGYIVTIRPWILQTFDVTVSGAVTQSIRMPWNKDDTIEDLLFFSYGLTSVADSNSISIFSQQESSGISAVNTGAYKLVKVKPGDNIVVGYKDRHKFGKIRVLGEVKRPGTYPVTESQTTVDDILNQAGGLGPRALKNAIFIISRENPAILQKDVEVTGSSSLKIETSEQTTLAYNLWTLPSDFKQALRASSSTKELMRGPIPFSENVDYLQLENLARQSKRVIRADEKERLKKSLLTDGDVIFVPFDDQTIQVFGQVNNTGLYTFEPGKKVSDYVDQAGGFSEVADQKRVFILKAGTLEWLKPNETTLESGDAIYIDRKPIRTYESQIQLEMQKNQFRLSLAGLILSGISTIVIALSVLR